MKQLALMFVMLSGTISNHVFGNEYILHFEEFLCHDTDFQIDNDGQVVVPGTDKKTLNGEVVHETEILVQSGSRLFAKSVAGKTTTTIRGELKAMPEPGRFQLVFSRQVTEASGNFLRSPDGRLIDISPKKEFFINKLVELGKPYSMVMKSEKGALILSSIRLEPAKNPN